MRYEINMSGKKAIDSIIVKHKGESIVFRGTQKVNNGNGDEELFHFLNVFFDGVEESKLNKLWEKLKDGKRILEPGYFDDIENKKIDELRFNNLDYKYLTENLEPVLNDIYKIITPEEICYAGVVTEMAFPPKNLMRMSMLGDYPEDSTINEYKYEELAKLTFVTQVCFPIISQLLDHVTSVVGKDYKDAIAGALIRKIKPIVNLKGWEILNTYVRSCCLRYEVRRNTISIVSEDKYIDYMVYTGLFNKLCLSFIPSREPYKNLSHGLNALVSPQMRDSNGVKFKSFTDPRPGSEDKSIVETYSICQSTNGTDELAAAEFFSFGMYDEKGNKRKTDIFSYQCKALGIKNQHLVEKLYNTLPTIWDFRLSNIHTKLIQLTFINDINYNLIPVLNYEQFLAAVCLTQVKLFEMGFEHLAVLSCAIRNPENPTYFLDDSFKLTTKEREELISLCDVYIGQSISTTENIIVKSTTDFIDELCSSGWDSNIEVGLLGNEKYVNAMSIGQMYQIDLVPEIKKELLELIKIANITEENE